MRNKFAGICYRCGERVEVGAGHFERHNGGWRTQHADCAIKHRNSFGTDLKRVEPDDDRVAGSKVVA